MDRPSMPLTQLPIVKMSHACSFVSDIIETSVMRGDGLTESMKWFAHQLELASDYSHWELSTKNTPKTSAHAKDAKHGVTYGVSLCKRNNPLALPIFSTYGHVVF